MSNRFDSVIFLFIVIVYVIGAPSLYAQETIDVATASSTGEAEIQEEPSGPNIQEQRSVLERQLADLEKEIAEHQTTIDTYQKQGKNLKGEIGVLTAKVSKLNLQIKAITLTLGKLNDSITKTQRTITQTEDKISVYKDALSHAVRSIYESDQRSLAAILLAYSQLSSFFGNLENTALVQNNLRAALIDIVRLRQELLQQKQELALQKEDAENLRAIQNSQKKQIEVNKTQKAELLKITKGRESEYQKLLNKTREAAAHIRTRIFELLGGGELTFEKAYDYAHLAEGATGVRASLTLAILHRESLLGKNVGRCFYTTAMHPTRDIPYFLDLLTRLNIDPLSEFAKVSCPNRHGTYGGAMGPAQFIPSTWKIHEAKVVGVTGNNPPNPWNNADAFAATALYMQNLLTSKSCQSYAEQNKNLISYQTLLERCAAAQYYAGSRWYTYRFFYGEPVVARANEYEKDIALLKESDQNPSH